MKRTIYLLTAFLILQSCASFDKDLKNPNLLNKNNISDLNGLYQITEIDYDSTYYNKNNRQIWMYNNFLKEIDRKLLKDSLNIDSLKSYQFGIKILNKKKVEIKYIENNNIIRIREIKTKLKNDGYLYLKNKNLGFILIPYIAGAIDIKRTRFTKSENGNLIFDVSNHTSGAILLFGFLDGTTRKYRLEYKKIK